MLRKFGFFKKVSKEEKIAQYADNAEKTLINIVTLKLSHLDILDYNYTTDEAIAALDLDDELMQQLVEDYVMQIIKSTLKFDKYLQELQKSQMENKRLNYIDLRELAHKNLGVARNLRIKDSEILLYELMVKEDITYLNNCIKALKACSIKLKPECAYKTLKSVKIKNFFL